MTSTATGRRHYRTLVCLAAAAVWRIPPVAVSRMASMSRRDLGIWLLVLLLIAAVWLVAEILSACTIDRERTAAMQQVDGLAEDIAGDARDLMGATATVSGLVESYIALSARGALSDANAVGAQLSVAFNSGLLGVAGVSVIGPDGKVVWSSHAAAVGTYVGDRPYFAIVRDHPDQTYIGEPLPSRIDTGSVRAAAIRALRGPAGAFAGEILISLDPEILQERLTRSSLRTFGTAGLLRTSDLVTLVHSRASPQLLGKFGGRQYWGVGEHYAGALAEELRARPSGHGRALGLHTHRMKLMAWRQVAGTPLTVVVSLDEQEILAEALARERSLHILALLASVIALGARVTSVLRGAVARRDLERQRAEQAHAAVEAASAEMRRLLSDLPAAVIEAVATAERARLVRVLAGDPVAVMGYPAEDIVDVPQFFSHLAPEDRTRYTAYRAVLLRDGAGMIEAGWIRGDGRRITLSVQSRAVGQEPDGTRIVVTWSDVTELARLRLQTAIAGRLSALGEMATGIAHELNQPLAIISMAADNLVEALCDDHPDLPSVRRRAERVALQAMRASSVIEELMRFSAPNLHTPMPVVLADAWAGSSRLVGGALQAAVLDPEVDIPCDLPEALGTLAQIEQVMVNLVLNARDALVASQPATPLLRLTARAGPDSVTLEIADNGGGIREDALPRIFEPFYTTKGPGGGIGLGLSICYGIMRTLGGTIAARNESGGAVFTLIFRRASAGGAASTGVVDPPPTALVPVRPP
jgi:C4-dicarboxylate-specific signal transduction histidine kinase